ncbi:unnamed protein product [Mytilus edulis]|uniref:Ankyrin repeat protein n=1 Tax=Mytilus edulis TaxID=6550 RepID=A0A8S3Q7H1_MYTED|nr:unnamed protein product [Mytilus edulis]
MTDVGMIDMNQAMTNILSIDVKSDSYSDEDKVLKDEKKEQLAMTIIQKTSLSMLNIDELIKEICKNGWLELLQLIWSNKDHSNINIDQSKIDIACEYGRENIVHWAVSNLDLNMINVKVLMTESCSFGWLEIVKKIWTTEENGNFDIKSAMNEGCSYGRVEVVTWLIQNADNNLFDMNVVMETSCRNGWIDIIKNILPLDLSTCNATVAITAACTSGNVELVQLFTVACAKGWDEIAEILLNTVDHNLLHIENNFMNICRSGEADIVSIILKKVDHNLLNLHETITSLIKDKKNEQVVLNIIKNAHKTKWDKQSLSEKAREHSWWKVLAFLNTWT